MKSTNKNESSNDSSPFITPSSSPTIGPIESSPTIGPIESSPTIGPIESSPTIGPIESSPTIGPIELSNNETIIVTSNENNTTNKKTNEDISLDTLILNLKIISKLKPGYKLSLKENDSKICDIFIDTSYLNYIYRFFSNNSRDQTTNFLESLDKEITKKIEEIVNEDYNDSNMFLNSKVNILLNLSHNLNLSLVGLNNLINTYIDDEYIISKIEMIINNFELKIRKISNILKLYK
jgi:hypothetical protein